MRRLARVAAKKSHVVLYDRRGYGDSQSVGGPYTLRQNIDDLKAIISEVTQRLNIPIGQVVLFGHSMGGVFAIGTAAVIAVKGVAIFEMPLSWLPQWPQLILGPTETQGAISPEQFAEDFMRRVAGDQVWERLPMATRKARMSEGLALRGELLDLRKREPWAFGDIGFPLRIGYGSAAVPHLIEGVKILYQGVPSSTTICIAGAEHGAHLSHAREVYDELIRPLVELEPAG